MTYTVDLDAIMARADAATAGPWTTATTGVAGGDHWYVCDEGEAIASISTQDGINEDQREPDAEFIAHAREDVPALAAEVRSLATDLLTAETHSFHRILNGDPDEIEAALDALPVRAVVTSEAFGEPGAFIKGDGISVQFWHGSGRTQSYYSRHLARYCAPLVVIR